MKTLFILILFTATAYGQQTIASTKVTFVKNVLKSIQTDDFELFKEHVVDYELLKLQDEITEEEYITIIGDMFEECKLVFSSEDIDISIYEVYTVEEPYNSYMWYGYYLVRFFVILKNTKGEFLRLNFSDCPLTDDGFKLGEIIGIR